MAVTREQVLALLEPTVEGLGYELAELECRLGRGRGMLRLFIDREEGIALEDCERVSREVAAILDVEDPIPGDYDLEVSSPGLDRKLVKPLHFDRFAGCEVKVRLRQLLDNRRKFRGTLVRRDGDDVVFEVDGTALTVPIEEIEVARLVPDLSADAPGMQSGGVLT